MNIKITMRASEEETTINVRAKLTFSEEVQVLIEELERAAEFLPSVNDD